MSSSEEDEKTKIVNVYQSRTHKRNNVLTGAL